MVITCEECLTRFNFDESLIKKGGSRVRCCQCKHIFTAYPASMENHEPPPFILPLDLDEKPAIGNKEEDPLVDAGIDESTLERDLDIGFEVETDDFALDDDLEFDLDDDLIFDDDLELDDGLELEMEEDELDFLSGEAPVEEKAKDEIEEFDLELDVDLDLNLEMITTELETNEPPLDMNEPDEEINLSEFDEVLEAQGEILLSELPEEDEPDLDFSKDSENAEINGKESVKSLSAAEDQEKVSLSKERESSKEIMIEEPPPLDYGINEEFKKPVKVGKPILIILMLAILILVGYSTCIMYNIEIPYISTLKVPFLSDYLKPLPPPQVPIPLAPEKKSVNGRFVTNTTAGTLFVITGDVKNTSEALYSHIRIKGTLISKENVKAKEKTVYCGNIISEEDLKSIKMTAIEALLLKKTGNKQSNIDIKPGQSIPFMIVFSDLPANLENFTVNVADFDTKVPKQ